MAGNNQEAKVTFKAFNKDFNKALAEMRQESSRLKAEMKLEQEQLKANGTEAEKLQSRIKYLESAHQVAARRVAETAAQVERAKTVFGENSEEVRRLESQLVNARIEEQRFANDLQSTNARLADATDETKKAAAALQSDFSQAISEIDRESARFRAELQLQEQQLRENGSETDRLRARITYLDSAHQNATRKVNETNNALQRARTIYGQNSNEVSTLERQLLEAQTAEQRFANDLREANNALQEQTNTANRAGQAVSDVGGKITEAGNGLTATATPAIIAFGAAAGKVANDFDALVGRIKSGLGTTQEEAERLATISQNVWKDGWGEDLQSVGDSIVKVKNNMGDLNDTDLTKVTSAAQFLDERFEADINESTRAAGQLMKDFGVDSTKAMDMVTWGFQNGLDYTGEFLDTLREYSPQFSELGYTGEQMLNTLKAGFDAGSWSLDKIGDSIKESHLRMGALDKATVDAYKSMGLNADEYVSKISKGGKEGNKAFQEIVGKLMKVDDATERNALSTALFGTQYEDLREKVIFAMSGADESIEGLSGTTEQAMSDFQNNFGKRLQKLFRDLQTSLIPLGEVLLELAEDYLPKISSAIQSVAQWFSNLSPYFQKLIVIVGAITMAIGPFLAVLGFMIQGVSAFIGPVINLVKWISKIGPIVNIVKTVFAALTGPIGLIIAIVTTLAIVIYKNWDSIKAWTIAAFSAVKDWISNTWTSISNATKTALAWIVSTVSSWGESIKGFFSSVGTWISGVWSKLVEGTKSIFSAIISTVSGWIESIKGFFTDLVSGISNIWNSVLTTISNVWNTIIATVVPIVMNFVNSVILTVQSFITRLIAFFQPLITFFVNTFNNIKLAVLSIVGIFLNLLILNFDGLKASLLGLWTAIKNQIINIITTFKDMAINIFNVFINGITTIFNTGKAVLLTIWNALKTSVITVISALKTGAIAGFNALKSGITTSISALKSWAIAAWNGLKSSISNSISAIKNGAVNGFNALKSGVTNAINTLKNSVISAWNTLKSSVSNSISAIRNAATNGFNTVKSTVTNAISGMKTAVSDGISNIKSKFTEMKSNIISAVKGIDLAQIGSDIVQGLINGISSKIGAVKDKVTELANSVTDKVRKLLDIHSPSRVMQALGQYVGDGFVKGISGTQKDVEKASSTLASKVNSAVQSGLDAKKTKGTQYNTLVKSLKDQQSKLDAIAKKRKTTAKEISKLNDKLSSTKNSKTRSSLSKQLASQKKQMDSLNSQYKSLESKISSTKTKISNVSQDKKAAQQALGLKSLQTYLSNQTKKLDSIAKKRDTVNTKLKDANKKLSDLIKESDKYADDIANKAKSYGSVASIQVNNGQALNANYIKKEMEVRLKNIQSFAANVEALRKKGVSNSIIDDILQQGVESGSNYAAALANADKNTIKSINSTQSKINSASDTLGKKAADAMYSAGINAAKGLVKGLESQKKELDQAANKIAEAISKAIKTKLKIHSPSRVMRDDIGKFIPLGLIEGIQSLKSQVVSQAQKMSEWATPKTQGVATDAKSSVITTEKALQMSIPSINFPKEVVVYSVLDGQVIAKNQYPFISNMLGKDVILESIYNGGD